MNEGNNDGGLVVKIVVMVIAMLTGFVRVMESLESHGKSNFQYPGLENLEN